MTETITRCDRCQARCDRAASLLALKRPGDPDFSERDLCPDCHVAFQAWFVTPTPTRAHDVGDTDAIARPDPLTAACPS